MLFYKRMYTERQIPSYTDDEKSDIYDDTTRLLISFRKLKRNNQYISYENQEEASRKIVEAFNDNKIINTMVIAKTQSGKTGIMISTIKQYVEKFLIPIQNIYVYRIIVNYQQDGTYSVICQRK